MQRTHIQPKNGHKKHNPCWRVDNCMQPPELNSQKSNGLPSAFFKCDKPAHG